MAHILKDPIQTLTVVSEASLSWWEFVQQHLERRGFVLWTSSDGAFSLPAMKGAPIVYEIRALKPKK